MITGALTPTDGTITVNGIDILKNPIEAQRTIGYLPEHNPLYTENVRARIPALYG